MTGREDFGELKFLQVFEHHRQTDRMLDAVQPLLVFLAPGSI